VVPWKNVLLIALSLVGFGVIHSVTAGLRPRRLLSNWVGERVVEGFYRLVYNLLAVITLSPTLALLVLLTDMSLYSVRLPLSLALLALQAAGLLGRAVARRATDFLDFIGVRQVMAFFSGAELPLPPVPMQTRGMYAVTRHPLYFFSLVVLWASPTMSVNYLAFVIGATLYMALGSLIEERRLERMYGDSYRHYRQRVPWLIPMPRFSRSEN